MVTNHAAVIIIIVSILVGAWGLYEGKHSWTIISITTAALCGLSIFYHFLQGQPIW